MGLVASPPRLMKGKRYHLVDQSIRGKARTRIDLHVRQRVRSRRVPKKG